MDQVWVRKQYKIVFISLHFHPLVPQTAIRVTYTAAVPWIRIRIRMDHFGNPDPRPHQIKIRIRLRIKKKNQDPDPHQSDKSDQDPHPHPYPHGSNADLQHHTVVNCAVFMSEFGRRTHMYIWKNFNIFTIKEKAFFRLDLNHVILYYKTQQGCTVLYSGDEDMAILNICFPVCWLCFLSCNVWTGETCLCVLHKTYSTGFLETM